MKNTYFKCIIQKSSGGKSILVAVIPDNFVCEGLPMIFEIQAFKMAPTIYTGTYPQIKMLPESIIDRTEDLKGLGISGILTSEEWYNKAIFKNDDLGISLPSSYLTDASASQKQ